MLLTPLDIWQCLKTFWLATRVYHWHLEGRSQRYCQTSYDAQDNLPQQRIIWLKMSTVPRLRFPGLNLLFQYGLQPQICRHHHPYGRKWRGTEVPLDESERGEWKSWLKTQHLAAALRWRKNRMGRPLSPPQIHQKIIWMLSNFHKTTSECWQRTPGTQKGSLFSSKGGRTKYKGQKVRQELGTETHPRDEFLEK